MITGDAPFGMSGTLISSALGGFESAGIFVGRITVPGNFTSTSGNVGTMNTAEYQGPPTTRMVTVSTLPCDFRPVDPTGANGPMRVSYGNTASISFTVTGTAIQAVQLVAGNVYYLNVRNYSFDLMANSCNTATCDAIIAVNPPK